MISTFSRGAIGEDASGQADAGQGTLVWQPKAWASLLRTRNQAARSRTVEQDVLAHIGRIAASTDCVFSPILLADYYVSLKTNPFVILTGPEGRGKTELVDAFAHALLGPNSMQYARISGSAMWPQATGEGDYYQSLQARFGSWRFLELLAEASDPSNAGKLYFVCFDNMHPRELEYYFAELLLVAPNGEKRLNLYGSPSDMRPTLPPNLLITATVDLPLNDVALSSTVLRHAGLIEFRASPARRVATSSPVGLPPVGYQRVYVRPALRDVEHARAKLQRVLGDEALARLGCSPELARLLWGAGEVLNSRMLQELTIYVANSFDDAGSGMFDPADAVRNAQIAFDAQVVQRLLWRLQAAADEQLRSDLRAYLEGFDTQGAQPAAA